MPVKGRLLHMYKHRYIVLVFIWESLHSPNNGVFVCVISSCSFLGVIIFLHQVSDSVVISIAIIILMCFQYS